MMTASEDTFGQAAGEGAFADAATLLDTVTSNALDAIMVLEAVRNREGEVEDFVGRLVNERAAQLLDCTVEELTGQPLYDYLGMPKEEGLFPRYLHVLETGEPYHDEVHYDRELISGWFDVTVAWCQNGVVVTAHEVTEHKETQRRLEDLDRQRRLALNAAQMGTWDYDYRSGAIQWDEQCRAIFGVGPEEDIDYGRFIETVHPEDRARVQEAVEEALSYEGRRRNDYETEYRLAQPEGAARWVSVQGKAYFESDEDEEEVTRFTGTVEDITERRRSKEALRRSEAMKSATFEAALDAIVSIDQESRIIEFNSAAERIFGYDREEVLGEPMHEHLVPPHLREAHLEGMARYLDTGQGAVLDKRIEITAQRADGTQFPVELAILPIELEEKELFTAYLRDITERKQWEQDLKEAQQQAEAANRAKSQFLANMSHELRTPLNAVIGYSEMLQDELAKALPEGERRQAEQQERNARFQKDLSRIHRAGEQLLNLVNDVLDVSKIEAGKMKLRPKTFDIASMVHGTADTVRPLVQQNGNRLTLDCPDDLGTMHIDRTKLQQVLFNLLSNAAKFTEEGDIEMRVRRQTGEEGREEVHFAIEDTGIGISEEDQQKLFENFAQVDTSLTRNREGTGLGLVISQNLSQMMGGDLVMESKSGVGSCFTVRLPVQMERRRGSSEPWSLQERPPHEGEQSGVPAPAAAPTASGGEGGDVLSGAGDVVLVIEDDEQARDLITRRLQEEGFAVVTAADGSEGLAVARELQPAVITLDVLMPEVDGWEVLSALKNDDALCDIPVVVATIVGDRDVGYTLGASDYLVKPIDTDRLVRIVQKHTGEEGASCSVLVVEDDEATRRLVRQTLAENNCTVEEAENGRAALGLLDSVETLPDVVLLDLMLPEVDGFALLEKLRTRPAYRNLPIIVFTAKDLTAEERRRLGGEVDGILQKGSYSRRELLDRLHQAVAEASDA